MAKTFQNNFCHNITITLQCSKCKKIISLLKTSKTRNNSEYHPMAFNIAIRYDDPLWLWVTIICA